MAKSERGASVKQIARERIGILFDRAGEEADSVFSTRYVHLAREIAMKQRLRLSSRQKRTFCRNCGAYFTSQNLRVRVQRGKVVYTCQECGNIIRIPIKNTNQVR